MEKAIKIPEWLGKTDVASCPCCSIGRGKGFVEKNIEAMASFIKEVLLPEGFANRNGLLQAIDPRARLLGILLFMVAAAILKGALSITLLLWLVILMAAASRVNAMVLLKRALPVLLFTSFLVLPSTFNFITPGAPVITISERDAFYLYISKQGLEGIAVSWF